MKYARAVMKSKNLWKNGGFIDELMKNYKWSPAVERSVASRRVRDTCKIRKITQFTSKFLLNRQKKKKDTIKTKKNCISSLNTNGMYGFHKYIHLLAEFGLLFNSKKISKEEGREKNKSGQKNNIRIISNIEYFLLLLYH